MIVIESAGVTDIGKKRKTNEDALFLDDASKLYVVADGMGGHLAGEVASSLVVATIRDYMQRFGKQQIVEELPAADDTVSPEANRLLASIRLANQAVHDIAKEKAQYHGMGSTVAAALFTGDHLIVANVGDSPVFLIHAGAVEQLSVTHNVLSEQLAANPGAKMTIGAHYQHMLTRAMGIEATVRPDISEIQCFKGDWLVLSSDGLTNKVQPREILEMVGGKNPQAVCKALVDLANERGGEDNITVIALKIREVGKSGGFWRRILRFFLPFQTIHQR